MRVIGMMSGTSFDAVDAAAADLTLAGDTLELRPLGSVSTPYPDDVRQALRAALPPQPTTMADVCRLDTLIGQTFADLAARANRQLCGDRAELVVAHGQTVYHWTESGLVLGTLQIGNPAWIAEATGLSVVSDLRRRDVAAGGQGAPLVSALDVMWLAGRGRRSVALNLGGIANITVVGAGDPIAYDTGPANALLDAYLQHTTGGRLAYDEDGALAAGGQVDRPLLDALLTDPYYARPAPKSTGKELFNLAYLRRFVDLDPDHGPSADAAATLTALTAETVAADLRRARADEVIAAGGGTRNPVLLAMLRDRLPGVEVIVSDELGLPAADKEAYAFAVLGFLTAAGLPAAVPSCTGARHASVLGSLTPGAHGLPSVASAQSPTRLVLASAA